MTLRRGDDALRHRQARPAQSARARRDRATWCRTSNSRCSPGRQRSRGARRRAARAGRRRTLSRKEIDDYTAFVGALRRKRSRLHQGERPPKPARRAAVADPQVPARRGRERHCSSGRRRRRATSCSSAPTRRNVVNDALGALRLKLGARSRPVAEGWAPAVGHRLPDVRDGTTATALARRCITRSRRRAVDEPAQLQASPARRCRRAYDMVLNGSEIGGGSIRIHRQEMQSAVFDAARHRARRRRRSSVSCSRRCKYGCPPHGGIAFGLDRLVDADGGRRQHPRRDRVPEDADRALPADECAGRGCRGAAERSGHSFARRALGQQLSRLAVPNPQYVG